MAERLQELERELTTMQSREEKLLKRVEELEKKLAEQDNKATEEMQTTQMPRRNLCGLPSLVLLKICDNLEPWDVQKMMRTNKFFNTFISEHEHRLRKEMVNLSIMNSTKDFSLHIKSCKKEYSSCNFVFDWDSDDDREQQREPKEIASHHVRKSLELMKTMLQAENSATYFLTRKMHVSDPRELFLNVFKSLLHMVNINKLTLYTDEEATSCLAPIMLESRPKIRKIYIDNGLLSSPVLNQIIKSCGWGTERISLKLNEQNTYKELFELPQLNNAERVHIWHINTYPGYLPLNDSDLLKLKAKHFDTDCFTDITPNFARTLVQEFLSFAREFGEFKKPWWSRTGYNFLYRDHVSPDQILEGFDYTTFAINKTGQVAYRLTRSDKVSLLVFGFKGSFKICTEKVGCVKDGEYADEEEDFLTDDDY